MSRGSAPGRRRPTTAARAWRWLVYTAVSAAHAAAARVQPGPFINDYCGPRRNPHRKRALAAAAGAGAAAGAAAGGGAAGPVAERAFHRGARIGRDARALCHGAARHPPGEPLLIDYGDTYWEHWRARRDALASVRAHALLRARSSRGSSRRSCALPGHAAQPVARALPAAAALRWPEEGLGRVQRLRLRPRDRRRRRHERARRARRRRDGDRRARGAQRGARAAASTRRRPRHRPRRRRPRRRRRRACRARSSRAIGSRASSAGTRRRGRA